MAARSHLRHSPRRTHRLEVLQPPARPRCPEHFQEKEHDVTYVYTSRLSGEPLEGIDGFHLSSRGTSHGSFLRHLQPFEPLRASWLNTEPEVPDHCAFVPIY